MVMQKQSKQTNKQTVEKKAVRLFHLNISKLYTSLHNGQQQYLWDY